MPTSMHEIAIWGVLLGSLLTLTALSLAEWLAEGRNLPALRNLVFVTLMGAAVILITGVPEMLWPGLDGRVLRMLKASLGPLAASVTLYYLGQWMGGLREDALMSRITSWSAALMLVLALGLALAGLLVPAERFRTVFIVTAVCNVLAVLPGFAASVRAAMLGDRLARWMALAVTLLAGMTTGLYLHGLRVPGLGTATFLATAGLTLAYCTLTSALVSVRNRQLRRLARLSRIEPGVEPATELPTGSHLLRKVDDLLWTAARRQSRLGVVCLYLDNLYDVPESSERSTEYQILVAMAARIRRAAGFRSTVGIYHPRCFVVAMALDADPHVFTAAHNRLRAYVRKSIDLVDGERRATRFTPRVGISMVMADANGAVARLLLDEAEQQARAALPAEVVDTQY